MWTLIPAPSTNITIPAFVIAGDIADIDGGIDGLLEFAFTAATTSLTPGYYVLAGRCCEGIGEEYLQLTSFNSGFNNFFEVKAPVFESPALRTFPIIAGLKLWVHAGAGITSNINNRVSIWADQSGFGNHFIM